MPKYLDKHLKPFELLTCMTVRHADEKYRLLEPRSNKRIGDRAFENCAPRLFNKLPIEIKDSPNIEQFKKKLKTFLFNESYDLDLKTITSKFQVVKVILCGK